MAKRTFLGRPIDFGKLAQQNEKTIAVGNANMNARGDLIGKGGQIIKTAEQLAAEYNDQIQGAAKQVSLRSPIAENPVSEDKPVAKKKGKSSDEVE